MTAAVKSAPSLASQLVNGVLAIKPLANLARHRARQMMIKRAESIGVDWLGEVQTLRERDWSADLAQVQNAELQYPDYYLRTFHAYDEGNLGWEPAIEVEVAAYAVHARIWQDTGAEGDARLRQSYHNVLKAQLPTLPKDILDLGCSVGMSTVALQALYPEAKVTGIDLSPYFLAVAHHRSQTPQPPKAYPTPYALQPTPYAIEWVNGAAEATGFADKSFDLVSACLLFHELPQSAATQVLQEARRLLRPGGHLAIMDMNPKSEIYAKMPPYILTLLKSTEPYLDEYFALDLEQALIDAGFCQPTITQNSPRHRAVIAQVA